MIPSNQVLSLSLAHLCFLSLSLFGDPPLCPRHPPEPGCQPPSHTAPPPSRALSRSPLSTSAAAAARETTTRAYECAPGRTRGRADADQNTPLTRAAHSCVTNHNAPHRVVLAHYRGMLETWKRCCTMHGMHPLSGARQRAASSLARRARSICCVFQTRASSSSQPRNANRSTQRTTLDCLISHQQVHRRQRTPAKQLSRLDHKPNRVDLDPPSPRPSASL